MGYSVVSMDIHTTTRASGLLARSREITGPPSLVISGTFIVWGKNNRQYQYCINFFYIYSINFKSVFMKQMVNFEFGMRVWYSLYLYMHHISNYEIRNAKYVMDNLSWLIFFKSCLHPKIRGNQPISFNFFFLHSNTKVFEHKTCLYLKVYRSSTCTSNSFNRSEWCIDKPPVCRMSSSLSECVGF